MPDLDPERLLRALTEHQVDFHVIGATAAWLQGSPTVTVDLDVMPRQDVDNADRLAEALNTLHARSPTSTSPARLDAGDFLGWHSQRFETDAGPIDIVPQAAAIGGYDDVATLELALGDFSVRVITIDEVIASKERLARPKDIAALPALYAARQVIRQKKQHP